MNAYSFLFLYSLPSGVNCDRGLLFVSHLASLLLLFYLDFPIKGITIQRVPFIYVLPHHFHLAHCLVVIIQPPLYPM